MPDADDVFTSGGAVSPPVASPSPVSLQWLIGLRLVVVSTLFLGVLIIQFYTRQILPIRDTREEAVTHVRELCEPAGD